MSKRAQFSDVVIDVNGDALEGVEVTVFPVGDDENESAIYSTRAGGATIANPIETDSTGLVQFFAEPGTYDLYFHDTELPARIADRTVTWDSISGDVVTGGIDVDQIPDGLITATQLASNAVTTAKITDSNVTEGKIGSLPFIVHQQTSAKAYSVGGAGAVPGLTSSGLSTGGWYWCMAGIEAEGGTTTTYPEFQIEYNSSYVTALAKVKAAPGEAHQSTMAGVSFALPGGVFRVTFNGNGANLSGNGVRGWLLCMRYA